MSIKPHFHAIVINVGADPRVGPAVSDPSERLAGRRVGLQNQTKPIADLHAGPFEIAEFPNQGEHMGSPLHRVIQWFKTMVTNEYIKNVKRQGWEPFENKIWQRIAIRPYLKISDYTRINPPVKTYKVFKDLIGLPAPARMPAPPG